MGEKSPNGGKTVTGDGREPPITESRRVGGSSERGGPCSLCHTHSGHAAQVGCRALGLRACTSERSVRDAARALRRMGKRRRPAKRQRGLKKRQRRATAAAAAVPAAGAAPAAPAAAAAAAVQPSYPQKWREQVVAAILAGSAVPKDFVNKCPGESSGPPLHRIYRWLPKNWRAVAQQAQRHAAGDQVTAAPAAAAVASAGGDISALAATAPPGHSGAAASTADGARASGPSPLLDAERRPLRGGPGRPPVISAERAEEWRKENSDNRRRQRTPGPNVMRERAGHFAALTRQDQGLATSVVAAAGTSSGAAAAKYDTRSSSGAAAAAAAADPAVPVLLPNSTYYKTLHRNFQEVPVQQKSQARVDAEADVRNAVSFCVGVEVSLWWDPTVQTPPDCIWNFDATGMELQYNSSKKKKKTGFIVRQELSATPANHASRQRPTTGPTDNKTLGERL